MGTRKPQSSLDLIQEDAKYKVNITYAKGALEANAWFIHQYLSFAIN